METLALAMFAAGLASGLHCVAMCGGMVVAFDARRVNPVITIREHGLWPRRIAFNLGRLSTYAAAGAVAGALGAGAYAAGVLPAQETLQVAVSVMLVFIGLYLAGAARFLSRIEALGLPLWRRLQPLAARLMRGHSLMRGYLAGLIWGWLPCAMVYAALAGAAASGSAAGGALGMAAFGLGTLPFLLAAGWLAARLRAWRKVFGGALLCFGIYGLAQADALGETLRRGLLCQ
jgi:hypothetical protein